MKLGEAAYKASQGGAAGPEAGAPGAGPAGDAGAETKSDEGVVDAQFEEVDPDKDKGKKAG